MKSKPFIKLLPVVIFLILVDRSEAQIAATFQWTGGAGDNTWGTSTNWNPSGPPAANNPIVFGSQAPAVDQTVLTGTQQFTVVNSAQFATSGNTIQFNDTGNLGYTLSGGALQFNGAGSGNYQTIFLGTSGTGSVTINSAISDIGTARIQFAGSGTRTVNLNGGITTAGFLAFNAPNARINISGSTNLSGGGEVLYYGGTIVAYNSAALGTTTTIVEIGNAKTLSLATNVTMGSMSLNDGMTINSASSADEMLSFTGRITGSTTLSVGSNGTGNATVALESNGNGTAGYGVSFATGSNGIIQFAQSGALSLGLSLVANGTSNGTGVISGAGSIAITNGGSVAFGATNTYTGQTQIQNGTLSLVSAGSIASSRITLSPTGTFSVTGLITGQYALTTGQELNGNGTVNGSITLNGQLTPGQAGVAGQLTFNNSLALSSSSQVTMVLTSSTISQIVVGKLVAGTLTEGNSTLTLALTLGSLADASYTLFILANGSGVSGDFGNVYLNNSSTAFTDNAGTWTYTDAVNGQLYTFVDSTGILSVAAAAPEPKTWALALFGLGIVVMSKRRFAV